MKPNSQSTTKTYRVRVKATCIFEWFRDIDAESPEAAKAQIFGRDGDDDDFGDLNPFNEWFASVPPPGWQTDTEGTSGDGDGFTEGSMACLSVEDISTARLGGGQR